MIPVELLTMGGGAILGGAMKFMAVSQKNKAEAQKLLIERNKADQDNTDANRQSSTASADAAAKRTGDPFAKATRRIIVLAVLGLAYWQYMGGLTGLDIVMPVTVQEGFNFLGIIDTTKEVVKYETFSNALVVQDWMKHSVLAIISFYFGTGAAKA